MPCYSEERKAAVMRKLLPPENRAVAEVARKEGTSEVTLYNWRKKARKGLPVPGSEKQSEKWSGEAKFCAGSNVRGQSKFALTPSIRKGGEIASPFRGME